VVKAFDLKSNLFGGAGSNPAADAKFFFFFLPMQFQMEHLLSRLQLLTDEGEKGKFSPTEKWIVLKEILQVIDAEFLSNKVK
jgi:hypothetical protein